MIALHIEKKRSFQILLLAEILLLLWGIIGLFGKDAVYEYSVESMTGEYGNFENIALPRGVYTVSLYYDTDTDMVNRCEVKDTSIGYKQLLTNGEHLYAGLNHTNFTMWILEDTDHLSVNAVYGGTGSLEVTGLTISETNAASRMFLFWVVVISLLVNLGYLYRQYDKAYEIPAKKKNVAFGLGVTILFTSLPLMVDYIMSGGDIIYHLMRIEGIRDGLAAGQFPVRIAPEWLRGHGYASSVFYGETLLYIAAFFRLIGFSVLRSYQMFFFLINIAGVLTAYYCFKKIFKEEYIGLLCSFLYNMSLYRCFKTYPTGAFGECFGILFLPFLAYGFYRVFSEDVTAKSYQKRLDSADNRIYRYHSVPPPDGRTGRIFYDFTLPDSVEKGFQKADIFGACENSDLQQYAECLVPRSVYGLYGDGRFRDTACLCKENSGDGFISGAFPAWIF